jgi:hypothetical protein
MTCSDLELWLDQGMPDAGRAAAVHHAESCRRCSGSLATAAQLDSLLGADWAIAPPGLADRVMQRVDRLAAARAYCWRSEPSVPWWIECIADRAVVLAAAVAALLVWRGEWIWSQAQALHQAQAPNWTEQLSRATAALPAWIALPPVLRTDPTLLLWVTLAILPLAFLAAFHLYRWSSGMGQRMSGPRSS